jgi:hypothetical protein
MKILPIGLLTCIVLLACGCAQVAVTKTAKGFYPATSPDDVEILMIVPLHRKFTELASVSTWYWETRDTAKMHNSLRAKSSALGADAVILGSSGFDKDGYFWASGAAIKYTDQGK